MQAWRHNIFNAILKLWMSNWEYKTTDAKEESERAGIVSIDI